MTRTSLRHWSRFIEQQRRAWKVPGLAVTLLAEDEIIHQSGFGRCTVNGRSPVTEKTPFCIGSASKAFTALVLGSLVDEGRLDWDAPVRQYIPELELKDPVATRLITARDLLTHRSGLPRHDAVWFGSTAGRAELVQRLRHLEPNKTFRQVYQYQNLMYILAGFLAERVSGQSWEELVRRLVFEPLGMTSSGFSFDGALESDERARGHILLDRRVRPLEWKPIEAAGPAGAITSTAQDMGEWVRYNLTGCRSEDGPRLIKPATLKTLHTPCVFVPDSDKYEELFYASYAMGWNVRAYRGEPMLSHGGFVNGFSTIVAFLPRRRMGVVAMANVSLSPLPQIVAFNAFDRLLGLPSIDWSARFRRERAETRRSKKNKDRERMQQRIPGTSPTLPLSEYQGVYEHPGYGTLIVEVNGRRMRSMFNSVTSEWEHYHYDSFIMKEIEYGETYLATFRLNEQGRIGSVEIPYEEHTPAISFIRRG